MDSAENPLFMRVFEFREAHLTITERHSIKRKDKKLNCQRT